MKVDVFLNPIKYREDAYEQNKWLQDFIDVSYEYDDWFKKLSPHLSFAYHVDSGVMRRVQTAKTCPAFISGFRNRIIFRNIADLSVNNYEGQDRVFSSHPDGISYHVEFHEELQLGKDFNFPKGKVKIPVKFMSPFWFSFSETVDLIFNPIWWGETSEIVEAVPAVIRVQKNKPIEININCFLKKPEEEEQYTIPKGKELCQVIVAEVKKPKVNFIKKGNKKQIQQRLNNQRELGASKISAIQHVKEHITRGK